MRRSTGISRQARRSVRVPDGVARTIRGLHPEIKRKLRGALEAIAGAPGVGKPLKEELAGLWSLRVGRFRVIYRMGAARTIEVVAFGPRERVYEETMRLVGRQQE